MSVRVKICGLTTADDARAAVDAGADFLGLNFHPASPRAVDLARAQAIAAVVRDVPLVGVFVDLPRAQVAAIAAAVPLALLQFHGRESPDDCRGWSLPVIKAIRAAPQPPPAEVAAAYATQYILLDSAVAGQVGGTGVAVDLAQADGLDRQRLFLAGGLRPETVAAAVRTVRPFAVDVASGVESTPGRKDHGKLEAFINSAKSV